MALNKFTSLRKSLYLFCKLFPAVLKFPVFPLVQLPTKVPFLLPISLVNLFPHFLYRKSHFQWSNLKLASRHDGRQEFRGISAFLLASNTSLNNNSCIVSGFNPKVLIARRMRSSFKRDGSIPNNGPVYHCFAISSILYVRVISRGQAIMSAAIRHRLVV